MQKKKQQKENCQLMWDTAQPWYKHIKDYYLIFFIIYPTTSLRG